MYSSLRYEILDAALPVDSETWQKHIDAFIRSFIVIEKRQRWQHFCLEKPEKAQLNSHKMFSDLIMSLCAKLDHEAEIALTQRKGKGIYYDFSGEAWWLTAKQAFDVGHGYESIFSLEEGVSGIYFWHEMDEFLCQK